MKVSREQMAENRTRILDVAGRLFRERGFEAVTVAEVMKAAGLTHGGFYGHFKSKDDLYAQAIAAALANSPRPSGDLAQFAERYLSERHYRDREGGCAVAALGSEAVRQSAEARAELTASLRRQIDRLAEIAPGETPSDQRQAAIGSWAALVGALTLARMSDDKKLADEVLKSTREWIAAGAK